MLEISLQIFVSVASIPSPPLTFLELSLPVCSFPFPSPLDTEVESKPTLCPSRAALPELLGHPGASDGVGAAQHGEGGRVGDFSEVQTM